MGSKAFLFVCLSLAILSIITSSQGELLSGAAEAAAEAAAKAKDVADLADTGNKVREYAQGINMAKENTVTIALTFVSVVISCLAFADIVLLN